MNILPLRGLKFGFGFFTWCFYWLKGPNSNQIFCLLLSRVLQRLMFLHLFGVSSCFSSCLNFLWLDGTSKPSPDTANKPKHCRFYLDQDPLFCLDQILVLLCGPWREEPFTPPLLFRTKHKIFVSELLLAFEWGHPPVFQGCGGQHMHGQGERLSVTSAVVQLHINISTLEASTKTTVARALCRTLYCLFVFFLNITQHAINLLIWRSPPPDRFSPHPGSQSNLCMHACAPSVFCSFISGKCTMCRRSTSSSMCRPALPQGSSFFKRRGKMHKVFC